MTADFFATVVVLRRFVESLLGPFVITPFGEEFTAAVPGDALTYKQTGDLTFTQWALFPGTEPARGPAGRQQHRLRRREPRWRDARKRKHCCFRAELR